MQGTAQTIARTQAYALRQLDALAQKLERGNKMGPLAEASREAEAKVEEWLAVLARCFHLQDALAVLELDRVLDTAPAELDQHRLGLRSARNARRDSFAKATASMLARVDAASGVANSKVLLNPWTPEPSSSRATRWVRRSRRSATCSAWTVGASRWTLVAGERPRRTCGTRCWRPAWTGSTTPAGSGSGPLAGPAPHRAGCPQGSRKPQRDAGTAFQSGTPMTGTERPPRSKDNGATGMSRINAAWLLWVKHPSKTFDVNVVRITLASGRDILLSPCIVSDSNGEPRHTR